MEPEVATFLAQLDPHLFVVDCLPNMVADEIQGRASHLVRTIRDARPGTPILLVEDRTYGDAQFVMSRRRRNENSREAFKKVYGQKNLELFQIPFFNQIRYTVYSCFPIFPFKYLKVYQMHYRQNLVSGKLDLETYNLMLSHYNEILT